MTVQSLVRLALLVPDYDEAIAWYTGILGFELVEDTQLAPGKRWVVVRPPGTGGASLLLAEATTAEQTAAIGNQAGGRVFLFLHTDNFDRDHESYLAKGVQFLEGPRIEAFGKVAVFQDRYGNKWDLIQPYPKAAS